MLTEILRKGARQMLAAAIEDEVARYIAAHAEVRDSDGRRLVVRNGHTPERSILTGLGPIEVKRPRVDDRRTDAQGKRMQFTSKILPPYLRRTKSIDELVPWLYLKGISTGDFPEALQALLGPDADGLSAATSAGSSESGRTSGRIGRGGTSPAGDTFTSGPTGFTSTSAWRTRATKSSVFWCLWARRPTARRN